MRFLKSFPKSSIVFLFWTIWVNFGQKNQIPGYLRPYKAKNEGTGMFLLLAKREIEYSVETD